MYREIFNRYLPIYRSRVEIIHGYVRVRSDRVGHWALFIKKIKKSMVKRIITPYEQKYGTFSIVINS